MIVEKLLKDKSKIILYLAIFFYFLIFSLISFWKYYNFLYNGLDLAIINQVFYNSSLGSFLKSTIHPPSYLGDHFTPILFLLLPVYILFKHPLTLLILQTIILSLGVIPIYKISKVVLKKESLAILLAIAYLLNPFIQNINLFEFHFLPLAIFFLLFTFYFYWQKKFLPFLIFIFLSLLIREDISLVIFAFGFLALLDKRKIKWIITPLILAIGYFILASIIINNFSITGSYKFLYYYFWLGNSWTEIFKNLIFHPWLLLKRLTTLGNIEMVSGLLLPFAFLPILKPKYLILSVFVYLQILLGATGANGTILQMQYSTLFLPALFISSIFALEKFLTHDFQNKLLKFLQKERILAVIIFILAVIYGGLTLGPLPGTILKIFNQGMILKATSLKNQLLKLIPEQSPTATTYEFLTRLSSRQNLYSLNYVFLGHLQFDQKDYFLPENAEYLAIDFSDLIVYQLQYQSYDEYLRGDNNLRKIIAERNFGILEIADNLAILKKDLKSEKRFYYFPGQLPKIDNFLNLNLANKIKFWGYNTSDDYYQLFFMASQKLSTNYQLELALKDKNNKIVFQNFYPLAYGLYPTTEWPPGQFIAINYWFNPSATKKIPAGDYQLSFQIVELKGGIELDSDRSVVSVFDKIIPLGEEISLGEIKI